MTDTVVDSTVTRPCDELTILFTGPMKWVNVFRNTLGKVIFYSTQIEPNGASSADSCQMSITIPHTPDNFECLLTAIKRSLRGYPNYLE